MSEIRKGSVKWFNEKKGYGFIQVEGESDVFVHFRSIMDDGFKTLIDGELVDFKSIVSDKGPETTEVYRVNKPKGDAKTASKRDEQLAMA